jgi:hypothetical protein
MSPPPGFPGYDENGNERKKVYNRPQGKKQGLYTNQNSRCRIVLEDGGAPKQTLMLRERRNPNFQGSVVQILNTSKSISGSCCTRGGLESACGRKELKNSRGRTETLMIKAIPTTSWATTRLRSAQPSRLSLSVTAYTLHSKQGYLFSVQFLPQELNDF